MRRVIEEGMAAGVFGSGDAKPLAFPLFGAVNWIVRCYSPDGPSSSNAIAGLFADFFVAEFGTSDRSRATRTCRKACSALGGASSARYMRNAAIGLRRTIRSAGT